MHVFQFLNKERIWSLMLKTKEQCIILSAFNYSSGKGMYLLWIQMCTFLFSCYAFHLDTRVYSSRLPAGTWMTVWIIQPQQTVVTLGLLIHQTLFSFTPLQDVPLGQKKESIAITNCPIKMFHQTESFKHANGCFKIRHLASISNIRLTLRKTEQFCI